jgi:coronin-1B/1C/6
MFKIRHSKYRHIYCDAPKPENTFTGIRLSTVTGDQQYIKASAKYYVVALFGGGGPMHVGRLDRPGRFASGTSQLVSGHTGSVLDFDFNPFDDSMFASASEDTTIKLWSIPDDWEPTDEKGLAKAGNDLTESLVDLTGHRKKVTLLRFHPTAANVLASTSADYTVKTWDVEKNEVISSFDDFNDLVQDIVWDYNGDRYATSCKDKIVRLIDARTGKADTTIEKPHDGMKCVKLTFLGESGKFLTVGSSRQNSREVKIWDLKNLSQPLSSEKVDNASGVLLPLFDSDTNVLYLAGKGDGIIRPYEFDNKSPFIHRLNDGFRSSVPAKGCCMVPKRGLNIMECENARLLKLTNNEGIHPLSFIVPRKSDAFQDDIFPDCASLTPSHTADQWLEGSSKGPNKMSLDPADANKNGNGGKKTKLRTVATVSAELKEAQARIAYLEDKLKENKISF